MVKLDPSGVTITGAKIKLNSGGGGGSAAKASPTLPTQPVEAQSDVAGFVSEAKQPEPEWSPLPAFKYQDMAKSGETVVHECCSENGDACPIHGRKGA